MAQPQIRLLLTGAVLFLFSSHIGATNVVRMTVEYSHDEVEEIILNPKPDHVASKAAPAFSFAKHFQDHMVLQQAPARANIYGFSPDIGQKVMLQMVGPSKPYYYETTVAQGPAPDVGVWNIALDPMPANTTVSIKVESERGSLTLSDVIFGDVWICSGQSNMEFTVIQMFGAAEEIANAKNYPNIRIMTVAEHYSDTPLYDVAEILQAWTSPDSSSVGGKAWSYFSAVCWLFGKNIHKARGYPIGLVATDWGGTPVEAWSSPQALAKCGVTKNTKEKYYPNSYKSYLDTLPPEERWKLDGPQDNNSVLWNAMINPLLGMTIYGAIWYQGEADASGTKMNNYNCTFPTMIKDWRANFNKASNGQTSSSFPFGFVQLSANTPDPTISFGFPDIRWHQTADYGYVPNPIMPNVFMAVAMDLPDFNSTYGSIHPQDKQDVGIRLGLSGLSVAYGQKEMCQGPFPVKGGFTEVGLVLSYGDTWTLDVRDPEGFEYLCTIPQSTKWFPTSIIDSNSTSVTLQPDVCAPGQQAIALRYAWRESPCAFKKCAVYESVNGLPAPPFVIGGIDSRNKRSYFKFDGPTHI